MNVDYILTAHGIGGGGKSKDRIPPPPVVGLKAVASGSDLAVTWRNPDDTDFVGVRIVKNLEAYPTSEADGEIIYDGIGEAVTDAGVPKGQYIYYRAFTYDFDDNYQSDGSQIARGVVKADQTAPGAPTVSNKTYDSVTLADVAGHEYSLGGSVWQASNTFIGLEASTSYTFYQRKKETELLKASPASPGLTVTTNAPPYDDPYGSPGRHTLLAGTTTQGFFGEVPTADLITGTELAAKIGLSAGTSQFSSEPWLKFMLDKKVLFVAKKPYRHSVNWNDIKAANAVYGEKEILIGGNRYKVRLLKTSLTDPSMRDGTAVHGGEWNRLMLPIHEQAQGGTWSYPNNVGSNDVPNDWGIGYTDAQLHTHKDAGSGANSWMQETLNTATSARLYRGEVGVSNANSGGGHLTAGFGWRPCLEVVS